jgi:hypothetical protein
MPMSSFMPSAMPVGGSQLARHRIPFPGYGAEFEQIDSKILLAKTLDWLRKKDIHSATSMPPSVPNVLS